MSNASAFDMNALDNRIRELVAYARTRDGEDRSALFRNLIDLFLTGKAPRTEATREQLLDVVEAMIPHVDTTTRRTAADLLANMLLPPADLALRLCRDRASIVANLLGKAPFDEDDIIALISQTGREHHQILAMREDLSANVWIALARAAPSAPPFDRQSTLALWSDDLGILRAGHTKPKTKQAAPATNVTPIHSSRDEGSAHSATSPTNGIRILKTGNDLLAERTEGNHETGPSSPAKPAPAPTQDSAPENPIPPKHSAAQVPISPELSQFIRDDIEQQSPLKDPGPGGWSWRSDRDGLIVSLSPYGMRLLDGTGAIIGTSVLDMLGLNARLGHPVARALQRRSTIHDAPILLTGLDKPHQHWTLEATPLFSSGGGIFEGYEGCLTPVSSLYTENAPIANYADSGAMFLDDPAPSTNHQPAEAKPSVSKQSAAGTSSEIKKPANQAAGKTVYTPDEPLKKATMDAVGSILSEVLGAAPTKDKQASAYTAPATPSNNTMKPPPTPTDKAPVTPDADQIIVTLDLLDEALKRLIDASRRSTDPGIRLQGEIASACARSIREQVSKKDDPSL